MTSIANIKHAFDAMAPGLAADFEHAVRVNYARLVETYPQPKLGRLGGSFSVDAGIWRELVRPFVAFEGASPRGAPSLREDRLAEYAQRYAEDQIARFVAKLEKKLADLTDVEVPRISGATFTLRGKLGDRSVAVEQSQVLKFSSRGKPFHQWPARIYVDGAFTAEAAFKKLAQEA